MKGTLCLFVAILITTLTFGQKIKYTGALCEGGGLQLTVDDAPSGATYQWVKDGKDVPNETRATYNINTAGTYEVKVSVNGTTKTLDPVDISVKPKPTANFTSSPSNQCSNQPVFFTNSSTGSGLKYNWEFGDPNSGANNTSTVANPVHKFIGTPGNGTQNFTVKLTVTTGDGCTASTTKTVSTKQTPSLKLDGPGFLQYDNKSYFKSCTGVNSFEFDFSNRSTTNNTSYRIVWGDGTPDYTSPTFPDAQLHTYKLGSTKMLFIVAGANGCIDTAEYYAFVGSNPAVGLGNPGNTSICSGSSLTFPISNTSSNPPGTEYLVEFNDGSAPIKYTHPAPANVTHTFNISSCGTTSGNYSNSFSASIKASNPCQSSSATVVPIYVSQKPEVSFTSKDSVCVNTTATFTNTSGTASYIDNGTCINGNAVWSVSPSSGWSVTNGTSLGNDHGRPDPSRWTAGTNSLSLNFTTPGIYTIKLKTGNPLCGIAETTKTICVNPQPTASFTVNETSGCSPLTVKTTNTSPAPNCGNNSYSWSVAYSNSPGCTPNTSNYKYINGTSSVSISPEFQFLNPGTYTISLITKAPGGLCQSTAFSRTITVKDKPNATINIPASICQNSSINPTAIVSNCNSGTTTYSWSFPGGTPSTATTATPGTITYNKAGGHTISLTVTNECGSTTITQALNVSIAPDVIVPSNQNICAGTNAGGYTFNSSVSGTTYTWTNSNPLIGLPASGTGNIPAFTAVNNSNAPVTATITVTPRTGCSGPSGSFTITVSPKPIAPKVTTPITYCLNANAVALIAEADGENTLTWYNNSSLSNGTSSAPTPATTVAGTSYYYVTQTNGGGCKSAAAQIQVTVLPAITNNVIGNSQSLCTGGSASPLTQASGVVTGGNNVYTYQWEVQKQGSTTWEAISGATNPSYAPGVLTTTFKFRRIVSSGPCASHTSNEVTITVQGALSTVDISKSQTICAGTRPELLEGQEASGGSSTTTYQWETSEDNVNWSLVSNGTSKDFHPPVLNKTTYYRRKTVSGACSVYSSTVTITVNPKPVVSQLSDKVYCHESTVGSISFNSTPANNVTFKWQNDHTAIGLAASGNGSLPSFTAINENTPKVPVTATILVTGVYNNGGAACEGNAMNFKIITLPKIAVKTINNLTVCAGTDVPAFRPEHDAASFAGSSVSYSWTVSGSGISLSNGTGEQIPAFTATNNTSGDLEATITVTPRYQYNGETCNGTATSFKVIVKPGTPKANAGPDQALCAASEYTLKAFLAKNTTGTWTTIGTNDLMVVDPTSPTTMIRNMKPGNVYQLVWTVSGYETCPATKDTVVITNYADLTNEIDLTHITICAGQSIHINGKQPTGGSGIYLYQWQESTDGSNWSDITGQRGQNLTYFPSSSVSVRRVVNTSPCTMPSLQAMITVQPGVSNNTISSDQIICINNKVILKGSQPSGGDGQFTFIWEQSVDNGNTWTLIAAANGMDYQTGLLTQSTKYRRKVSTNLCSGLQESSSNIITVTVNPDAKAFFNPTDTLGCPPFSITTSLLKHQAYPQQNKAYQWYINDELFSNSATFPGFTMQEEDDTVILKLIAISLHGCLDDSISYRFYTYPRSVPDFTVSETAGCGPLTVQISNTTSKAGLFRFEWDFGNGVKSTEVHPDAITFQPNPLYGDTTYHVTMRMLSPCDTAIVTRSILVKSKPKALFTPTKTTGCSPMRVVFNNTSLGKGNRYIWDFGDGSVLSTAIADTVSHTFISGVRDTFYVKLKAINECGEDSLTYAIVVSPNQIFLDFALNGNEQSGCAPHTVRFINNSKGASSFRWDFGDGNILSTSRNIDTVFHTYQRQGNYTIQLSATNGCSDTTTTEHISVYPKPLSAFSTDIYNVCIGDSVRLKNTSDSATSFLWSFGDGQTSTLVNPVYKYRTSGNYMITLKSYRTNPDGTVCTDSVSQAIQVNSSMTGWFEASDSVSNCAPLTVTFTNRNLPSVTANWDFGDGSTGAGDHVTHTFTKAGTYTVTLTTVVPGGCTYMTTREIRVLGPSGAVTYQGGYLCNDRTARFQANTSNTDSIRWHFGDGTTLVTSSNVVYHTYAKGGSYVPSFILMNQAGCSIQVTGTDTIKVDKLKAGFTTSIQQQCGLTSVTFTDTTHAFFGKSSAYWNLGDGTTASGYSTSHTYNTSGSYTIQLIVNGNSGCSDTIIRKIDIKVNDKPIAAIQAETVGCTNTPTIFRSNLQSIDSVSLIEWSLSNGARSSNRTFTYNFTQTGTYTLRLIAGTVNGCFDTTTHTIRINASPTLQASNDLVLCLGKSAQLQATGAPKLNWQPFEGLNCTDCSDPIVTPKTTTTYVVQGTNEIGCSAYDTVLVTVIQPMNMVVNPNDSICIGQSSDLLASGATTYSWSPAAGLNQTTISNPTATPTKTTRYRVVGYDGFNCFTDTAFVTVAVGQYPAVNLGPDLSLATGTLQPLNATVQNGPIRHWQWAPATDLSCAACPLPVAHIKKDVTYSVTVTTPYGCSASDTLSIKAFCESAQVFIPNAFTPDGDGVNDVLMVRGKGIVLVKSFRIFNRWGEVVFEKSNFQPNHPAWGWDGKIRGQVGPPDVFVYTAEVVCENGTPYTFKGNVSLLK